MLSCLCHLRKKIDKILPLWKKKWGRKKYLFPEATLNEKGS